MRFTIALILLFSISYLGFSQRSPLKVSYERDSNNDYVFYCENKSLQTHTVAVYFNNLMGLNADTSLPAIKAVKPGKSRLFKLSKTGMGTPTFNWGSISSKGNAQSKLTEYVYVLPVAPGKETKTIPLVSLSDTYGKEKTPDDYYAIGFKLAEADTVYAIRGGKVVNIIQDQETEEGNLRFSRTRNKMEIEHKDGSIASYTIFKNNSAMVQVGDDIEVGAPLFIASGGNYEIGHHVRLVVLHLKADKEADKNDIFSWGYQTMKFKAKDTEPKVLMGKIKYTGFIDDEMITQEMSKRQKKKYLKAKKAK